MSTALAMQSRAASLVVLISGPAIRVPALRASTSSSGPAASSSAASGPGPRAATPGGGLSRSEPERRVDLARLVDQGAGTEAVGRGLPEVVPASRVSLASYLALRCDTQSKASSPASDPLEAAKRAMPSRFQSAHSRSDWRSSRRAREILIVELGSCGVPLAPAVIRTLNRDQWLQQLDHFGGLDLDVGPEIDDPGQPRLVLTMPAAGQRRGWTSETAVASAPTKAQVNARACFRMACSGPEREGSRQRQWRCSLSSTTPVSGSAHWPPDATTTVGDPSTELQVPACVAGA